MRIKEDPVVNVKATIEHQGLEEIILLLQLVQGDINKALNSDKHKELAQFIASIMAVWCKGYQIETGLKSTQNYKLVYEGNTVRIVNDVELSRFSGQN